MPRFRARAAEAGFQTIPLIVAVASVVLITAVAHGAVNVQRVASFERIDLPVDGAFYAIPFVVEATVDPADAGNVFPIDFGDYIVGVGGWLSGGNLRIPAVIPAPGTTLIWRGNLRAMCDFIDSPPGGPPRDGPPELHDQLLNAKGTDVMLTGFFFSSTNQAFGTFPDGMGGFTYQRLGCDMTLVQPSYQNARIFDRNAPTPDYPVRPTSFLPPEFLGVIGVIPEPSSAILLGLGGLATILLRRFRASLGA